MAATNETIDDIIAEMRAREDLDGGDMVDNFDIYSGEYGGWDALMLIKAYADRLEAAHKRERGDSAKLREAMCEILSYIESFHKYITPGKGKKLTALFAVADTIRNNCRAALAAPPRNCDRFGSSTQAREEWYKTEVLPRVEGVVSGVEPPFVDWLFSPATEQEGGAK